MAKAAVDISTNLSFAPKSKSSINIGMCADLTLTINSPHSHLILFLSLKVPLI
jgi:hypothetical protein